MNFTIVKFIKYIERISVNFKFVSLFEIIDNFIQYIFPQK